MNGRTTIPLNAWKVETASLASEKKNLYSEYLQLKEAVREAEVICRCVEHAFQGNELKPKIRKDVSRD